MKYALIINDSHEKSITLHNTTAEAEAEAYTFLLDTYIAGQLGKYIEDPIEKHELTEAGAPSQEYLVNYFDGEITYEIIEVTK